MREIEIKARVADSATLLEALERNHIQLSNPVTHHDRVFGMVGEHGDNGNNTLPWLRIRTEAEAGATRYIFTFKKSVTNQMDSIEYETQVASETELEKIILGLGFESYSDVTKTRRKGRVGDIEICYDEVLNLGVFIEAEKLVADDAEYDDVAAELWGLLESVGVAREHQVHDGYDTMMKNHAAM
jgi:adenylate cyclase class 2